MRLGHTQTPRDLVLAQVVEVAEAKSLALAPLEGRQTARDEEAVLALVQSFVGACNAGGLGQRYRAPHTLGSQGGGYLPIAQVCGRGQLRGARRTLKSIHQLTASGSDSHAHLLLVPRYADGSTQIPEIPADLAEDVRDGEGGEADAALGLEAVDCLDQAD